MNIEGNIKVLRKKYHRSEEQKEAANINRVFNKRKDAILFDDSTAIEYGTRYKAIIVEGIKNLTRKKVLWRVTIALAKVKPGYYIRDFT